MKQNYLFKTALLLLCAIGGVSVAWADKTPVAIPQDLGSFITWEKAETNCTVQGDNAYVGNTNGDDKYAEFTITNNTEQSYVMTFATGSTSGNTAELNVELTNSESTKVLTAVAKVEDTGGWTNFNTINYYSLENLPVGTYTLRISVKSRTSYAGNWSKLAFYTATQSAMPKVSDSYLEMSTGAFNKANDNGDNVINYIRPNGYISNVLAYNDTEGYYSFNFNLDSHKGYADGKVRITVSNALTGEQEMQTTADASSAGNKVCALPAKLTTGWKTFRFDFLSETASAADSDSDKKYLFNFQEVNFLPITQFMPLVGGTPSILDLSVWPTSGNPRYQSENQNLGYIYNGNTASFNFVNENENAYYYMQAGITGNVDGASLKVTIIDCATGSNEVERTFSVEKTSGYATQTFKLDNAISTGVKTVRFDFIKADEESWLYNINNITFYKRSLNEDYTFAPVAATGVDMVLTRSIAANKWSTIVLPFAMTSGQIEAAFGSGATVAQLTSYSDNTLNFKTVTEMNANEPYAIKVATAFSSATISGVTVEAGTPTKTSVTGVEFIGSYAASTDIPASDASNTYYFFSDNKLYSTAATGDANTMKGTRAYFKVAGTSDARTLDFSIDGETTGISSVNNAQSTVGNYFDLQGRRVAQPTKGLYIVNGKKIIIK